MSAGASGKVVEERAALALASSGLLAASGFRASRPPTATPLALTEIAPAADSGSR